MGGTDYVNDWEILLVKKHLSYCTMPVDTLNDKRIFHTPLQLGMLI